MGDSSTTPSVDGSTYSLESPLDDSSSKDDAIPAITHTVIFKCVGVTKEKRYQDTLKYARKKLDDGIKLPVKF